MTGKFPELDDDYKLAIGELVIQASLLDSQLTVTIGAITEMGTSIMAMVAIHPHSFATKIDILASLLRLGFESGEGRANVESLVAGIKAVQDLRNSVVHAVWVDGDQPDVPLAVRFRSRGKFTRSRVPVPVEKIRQAARDARGLCETLERLEQAFLEPSQHPVLRVLTGQGRRGRWRPQR